MARKTGSEVSTPRRGTAAYFLSRLERDRPDLAVRVWRGELSANAAAIEAGLRKPTITLPENLADAAAALFRRWGADGAERLAGLLMQLVSERRGRQKKHARAKR